MLVSKRDSAIDFAEGAFYDCFGVFRCFGGCWLVGELAVREIRSFEFSWRDKVGEKTWQKCAKTQKKRNFSCVGSGNRIQRVLSANSMHSYRLRFKQKLMFNVKEK